jgi:hypothetical protein
LIMGMVVMMVMMEDEGGEMMSEWFDWRWQL